MNVVVNPITVHPVSMRQSPFANYVEFVDDNHNIVAKLHIERQLRLCKLTLLSLSEDKTYDTTLDILQAIRDGGNATDVLEQLMINTLTTMFAQANMVVDWSVVHDPIIEAKL